MKKLAIMGKTINISKFAGKTKPQFRNQLRQNGIVLSESELDALYEQLTKIANKEKEEK